MSAVQGANVTFYTLSEAMDKFLPHFPLSPVDRLSAVELWNKEPGITDDHPGRLPEQAALYFIKTEIPALVSRDELKAIEEEDREAERERKARYYRKTVLLRRQELAKAMVDELSYKGF